MSSRTHTSPASPLPTLFLVEASLNIFGGTVMLLFPSAMLGLITHPSLTYPLTPTTPAPASIQLLQWLAALSYALSAPLLLGARNTPRAKASRRMVYETLGAGEVCLVAVMLWQASLPGQEAGSITARSLMVAALVLGGTGAARFWALSVKPRWFSTGEAAIKKT